MKIKLASAYFDINVVNKYTKIDLKLTKILLTLKLYSQKAQISCCLRPKC